jgi:16S rRNA (uracil1498-N3)-methyltransferase
VCAFGPPLRPESEIVVEPRPAPPLTLAFAVPKGDRPEWIVQKATELGLDALIPLHTAHSVVRWEGSRADHHLQRLRRVAREAAMQARRAFLPVVEPVQSVAEVAARPGAVLADVGGDAPSLSHPVVLIGPEGGWSKSERDQCPAFLGLGPTVLRVETASVAAGTLLAALRSGAVRPAVS